MGANNTIEVMTDKIAYLTDRLEMSEMLQHTEETKAIALRLAEAVEELNEERRFQIIEDAHRLQWHEEQEIRRAEDRGDFI